MLNANNYDRSVERGRGGVSPAETLRRESPSTYVRPRSPRVRKNSENRISRRQVRRQRKRNPKRSGKTFREIAIKTAVASTRVTLCADFDLTSSDAHDTVGRRLHRTDVRQPRVRHEGRRVASSRRLRSCGLGRHTSCRTRL